MSHDRHAHESSASRLRELGAFIREQRNTAQLSLRTLAERAGISNPYLSQIERGLRRPSADILQRVADALRISAETLYVQAGILEERRGDLDEHIRAAADLTESQKRALLEIYHAFRASSDQPQITHPATDFKEQS
jgi:transcriptional regulator with XRE-family HTH domain